VCRYAVDTSYKLGVVHHFADKALATAGLVRGLADSAMENDDGLVSQWAVIEARIYREKLMERIAAKKIRSKFPPKEPTADHPERWKRYVDAIADLAKAGAGSDRAVEGILRAIEFQLQACHWAGADREASVKGLKALEKMLAGKSEDAVAAGRAAVLLAEAELLLKTDATAAGAKIRGGLDLLKGRLEIEEPERAVVMRHNDLVTLTKLHPELRLKVSYYLVPCAVPQEGLSVSIPLSSGWRTLDWEAKATGIKMFEIHRLNPAGGQLSRISLATYDHGRKYLYGAAKQGDAKKPKKLAAALFEKDKDFGLYGAAKKKKRTGPKRVRLNDKVKAAYLCEVLSQGPKQVRPWYYRLRVWIFSGKERSYGIRLDDRMNDGVELLHPDVAAMLSSVRGE
jgi:hypothetical protein